MRALRFAMILFGALLALAPRPAWEQKGLVLYYNFETGKGKVARDLSGKRNDGKIHDAYRVEGDFGRAIEFNGRSSWIDCGKGSTLDIAKSGTISLWYIAVGQPGGAFAAYFTGPRWVHQRLVLGIYSSRVVWAMSDGKRFAHEVPLRARANTWVHIALAFDGKAVTMYQNGKQVQVSRQTVAPALKDVRLVLGKSDGLGRPFFEGVIDDVRIYDRALSAEEIRKIHKMESKGR